MNGSSELPLRNPNSGDPPDEIQKKIEKKHEKRENEKSPNENEMSIIPL